MVNGSTVQTKRLNMVVVAAITTADNKTFAVKTATSRRPEIST
jgi:hypothetical protein